MENLANSRWLGFQKDFVKNPRKKPDALIPSSPTPPHSRTSPTTKIVARVTRERKWILFPRRPGKFWHMGLYCSLLSETSVGDNNCTALCTNAGRVLTSSFFLSCTLMFTTVL